MSFLTNLKLEDFIKLAEEKKEIKYKKEIVDEIESIIESIRVEGVNI